MVIPTYNRTLKEFEAPFSTGSKDSTLELESSSEVTLPDPFWPEYEQKECCPGLWYRLRRILPGCLRAFALRGARR